MGKYVVQPKTANEIAVMEVAKSLGVRTRAMALALQRIAKASPPSLPDNSTVGEGEPYLQLRNRRLQKPAIPINSKRLKRGQDPSPRIIRNPNLKYKASLKSQDKCATAQKLSDGKIKDGDLDSTEDGKDLGVQCSFGENLMEIDGRERESTPCKISDPNDGVNTPGSSTRPTGTTQGNRRLHSNALSRHIPTAHEMDAFFSRVEEEQQKEFMDKYNFDPVNDKPVEGDYEWEKLNP